MARLFILYKRVDKEKVFNLKKHIEAYAGEKCWINLDGIESDAQFKVVTYKLDPQSSFTEDTVYLVSDGIKEAISVLITHWQILLSIILWNIQTLSSSALSAP